MATGTGNLPNQSMSFSPFAILTAEEMNDIVENIESLADGSGIGDGAVTADKIDPTTQDTDPNGAYYDTGWVNLTLKSGWTVQQGNTPALRRIGNVVYAKGTVSRASGTGNIELADIPAGFEPFHSTFYFPSTISSSTNTNGLVANGVININYSSASSAFVSLHGLSGYLVAS